MSRARSVSWSAMTLLALLVAAYAAAVLVSPALRSPFLQQLYASTPMAISTHIAASLVAIALGAFQLNGRLRARYITTHRWLGRAYVIAVIIGGASGLALALNAFGGLVSQFGFGMLAVCWIGSTLNAHRLIREGDRMGHRAWMIRSYALTWAAVTLRVYLGLSQVVGIEFEAAYQAIAWLAWVPNLLVVEWLILAAPAGNFERAQSIEQP